MNTNKQAKIIRRILSLSMKTMGYCLLLVFLSILLSLKSLRAEEEINGNLVTVKWLEENLNNDDIILLDASYPQVYMEKHIPGAQSIDFFGIRMKPINEIEKIYQSSGISPGKKIVLYDEGGSMLATRVFFSLYYHGFPEEDLLILDGGLSKWQEEGLQVTSDPVPMPKKGTFTIDKLKDGVKVDLTEFLTASGDLENNVLLEALDPDWHYGEVLAFDRAGHIPNAILMPRSDFYKEDKTFKSAEEIRQMLQYFDINPEQQIHTHCGGGVAATVPFFALKFILDYPEVTLYEESQGGWLADERKLPYWTYDEPSLMRESNWLQTVTNKMMRMYRGVEASMLDIRTADIYAQGHMPFSHNFPAHTFKSYLTNLEQVTEILESSGVDISHEVVIISGAGLTKEAALAFTMLEEIGQKKVSVFMYSMEEWKQAGFEITKDTTLVGTKKNPFDLAIPPTTYPENLRKGVIIRDTESTQGLYPKVFIASGKNMAAKKLDGEVVHVPYTELLDEDGTPKAAKDIWNILSEAGVPRYAELVCYSDDPGEAAINYFILKLMGYPDIKVLVN